MSCPRCGKGRLVEIQVTVRERRLMMHSCSICELRWWDDEAGARLELDNVLDLASAASPRGGRSRAPDLVRG